MKIIENVYDTIIGCIIIILYLRDNYVLLIFRMVRIIKSAEIIKCDFGLLILNYKQKLICEQIFNRYKSTHLVVLYSSLSLRFMSKDCSTIALDSAYDTRTKNIDVFPALLFCSTNHCILNITEIFILKRYVTLILWIEINFRKYSQVFLQRLAGKHELCYLEKCENPRYFLLVQFIMMYSTDEEHK